MAITRGSTNLRVVFALPAAPVPGPGPRRRPQVQVPTRNIVVNDDEVNRPLRAVLGPEAIPGGQHPEPAVIAAKADEVVTQKVADAKAEDEPEDEGSVLPEGHPLLSVAGETLPMSAVGPALEFIEFCSAFYKPLKMKEVDAQAALREIVRGCNLKRAWRSQVVRVHMRLLDVILSDELVSPKLNGDNSWLRVLKTYLDMKTESCLKGSEVKAADDEQSKGIVADTECSPEPSPSLLDSAAPPFSSTFFPLQESRQKYAVALEGGAGGYASLAVEEKLQLLNLLCNETLSSRALRTQINKGALEYNKKRNDEKKKKIKAGELKATLSEVSTEDVSTGPVRTRSARAKVSANLPETSVSESLRQFRTDAVVWGSGSRALWKLKGGDNRNTVIAQVVSDLEGAPKEEWTVYSEKDKESLAEYVDRKRKNRRCLPK